MPFCHRWRLFSAVFRGTNIFRNLFQSEIGSISSDIKILQDKSLDMGLKLKNRNVWFLLGKFCILEDSAVILILMEAVMVVKERHPVLFIVVYLFIS
ncbi:hypothetical protein Pint_10602 [Pistacia integerrima]|uniref:Uncharacterized protein n=1 Tax=Pistacia integerrima TaxID=434235 RepID=A0ACC0XKJ6_9ROSI|nr:hypothetical protein Pint_10602 [Pistacia integerrima]